MRGLRAGTRELPTEAPRFYSVAEVARMFGMSTMTVYRAIAAGEFPAVKVREPADRPGAGDRGDGRGRGRGSDGRRRRRLGPRGGGSVSSVFEHLDQAVERLATVRDELLADPYAVGPRRTSGCGVRVRGARVVAGLRAVEPAADLAGGAGRRGGRAGERGRVGAARRCRSAPLSLRLRAGLPVGWVRPVRWPSPRAAGAVVGDAERRSLDLVLDPRRVHLREGPGRGRGGRVLPDRAGAVRVDPGRSGAARGGVGVRLRRVDGAASPALTGTPADDPGRHGAGRMSRARELGSRSGPRGPRNSRWTACGGGPVGPRRRTAGLPVKGARCARVAGDGLAAALDREPRRPCTSAPSAAGGQRPAAPAGPGRPALSQPIPGRQLVTSTTHSVHGRRGGSVQPAATSTTRSCSSRRPRPVRSVTRR